MIFGASVCLPRYYLTCGTSAYLPRYIFTRGIICGASASLPRYIYTRGKNFRYDCDIVLKPIFLVTSSKLTTDFEFPWHN